MSLAAPFSRPRPRRPPRVLGTLSAALALAAVAGLTCTAVWVLAGGGTYWPAWVWIGAAGAVGVVGVVQAARLATGPRTRWAVAHVGLEVVAALVVTLVWLQTDGAWLAWALLGIAVAAAVHVALAYAHLLPPRALDERLAQQVEQLRATRAGALDVQAAELRRIERDLHDGAQSRLVALQLLLGRAEARLGDESDAADLVRRAQNEASAAIAELRDLARGIAPPLLEERGLGPALEALALRSALDVRLEVDAGRVAPNAERAAYFVAAEALTNVAKHAGTGQARVLAFVAGDLLVVEVEDAGPGSADPDGAGLAGLRQRVRALDGDLTVGPGRDGAGTLIRAELPCAW